MAQRAVALVVDAVITLGLIFLPLSILSGDADAGDAVTLRLTGWWFVLYALLVLTYFAATEKLVGATPGKFLCGLRVRRPDGSPISWSQALVRNVARLVDAFPYAVPYLVGAILVWTSPERQRAGDRAAGTVVDRRR